MFAAELLLGGGPLGRVATIFASCAVAAGAIWAMRKKVPHPTEFACIGCCYLRGGCHKHQSLDLVIEVHEASNIPAGGNVYFFAEAGRFDCQTCGDFEVDGKTKMASIFERLHLHVRQMDDFITMSLWRSGTISSTLLGELVVDVQKEIIDQEFPQMQWFTLEKEGKATVKVQLSFHKVEGDLAKTGSPLVQYAMIKAQRDAARKGQKLNLDFNSLTDNQKLHFLSRVLEGPLKMLTPGNWREFYFKVIEGSNDRWAWKYWNSKQDCLDHKKAVGTIPLLAVSTVLADAHNRQQLYIKYYDKGGAQDVFLTRVDRDRDLWSDGLYEFLDRYRQYLQDHPQKTDAQAFASTRAVKETKELPKKVVALEPGRRRLLGPAEKPTEKPTEKPAPPIVPKRNSPSSVSRMIEDAMAGYDEEELEEVSQISELEMPVEQGNGATTTERQEEAYRRDGSTGGPL